MTVPRSFTGGGITLPMMRVTPRYFFYLFLFTSSIVTAAETPRKDARVTQVIREVNVLEPAAPKRPAVLNEKLGDGTAVRTGGESRAELTFLDLTITRLGANTIYSFRKAGRQVELNGGSILLRVPKNSGGATILSPAVTAGVTGTTLIFEYARAGATRMTLLEGTARLTLVGHPAQTRNLRAGQTLEVPAGATRIPEPTEVDLDRLMKTSPLIIGFRPLPSRDLIGAAIKQQQARGLNNNNPNQRGPQNPSDPPAPAPAPPPQGPGPR
ncbi:MAG: hypothetical protein QOH88_935 [Verrucomicrobiota bacterium]|jgi:hypothetical protein